MGKWNLENTYRHLPDFFYKDTFPEKVPNPKLILLNKELAVELGLSPEELAGEEGLQILCGNRLPPGSIPISQAYAGHQFGSFTMLGDGRAVLLGEQITPKGKRVDIQLKGSGKTAFSRGGDGKAVLGPMLREYIISEGLFGLGIPTTRSLAVVSTGEQIFRYIPKEGAILTRTAASHIRVGTFQYAAAFGKNSDLKALADYAIQRDPEREDILSHENSYLRFFELVMKRQADLIARWQLVGMIHGVMNTDNMTISGESIDFGPVAFMDSYDPATVFSSIDRNGRYAYANQPGIGLWNLSRFAETLVPLVHEEEEPALEKLTDLLTGYKAILEKGYYKGLGAKLGLMKEEEGDRDLANELLSLMKKYKADYTNTFADLTLNRMEDQEIYRKEDFGLWKEKWERRISSQNRSSEEKIQQMKAVNPVVIPRNYWVEDALKKAEEGDYHPLHQLLEVLKDPFAYSSEQEKYRKIPREMTEYQTYCGT